MTKEETQALLMVISTAYNVKFQVSAGTVATWFRFLSDLPGDQVNQAVTKHICENTWPPSIAEIRKAVAQLRAPEIILTGLEAWGLIKSAVEKFGFYRQEEAMANLPEYVAEIARRFGWRDICLSESQDVLRSNFIRMFESYSIAIQTRAQLPEGIQQRLSLPSQAASKLSQMALQVGKNIR